MTRITIEPRQFAQIGTPNYAGATIIPHAPDIIQFPSEEYDQEVMELAEIEQVTLEEDALAEDEDEEEEQEEDEDQEEEEDGDDDYSYVIPKKEGQSNQTKSAYTFAVKSVKTVKHESHNDSHESSSLHYDSSYDVDDLLKIKPRPMKVKKEHEPGSGEQFACRHCGKRYRWKSTLRRHERVECGGVAPSYGCPYCSYMAKQRGNLSVHMRKHHADKPQLASKRKSKNKQQ